MKALFARLSLLRTAVALLVCFDARIVLALDPETSVLQYSHDRWSSEQGFPGGTVNTMTETADGYLWIGTEEGLIQFDGINFRLFGNHNTAGFPRSPVMGLTPDAEGNLWIRLGNQTLLRYRDGRFDAPLPYLGPAETGITATCRGRNGELLFARSNGAFRYSHGRLETLVPAGQGHNLLVISMFEMPDGRIWLGTRDAGLFCLNSGRLSSFVQGLPDRKVNLLVPEGRSDLWLGTDGGVGRWMTEVGALRPAPRVLQNLPALAMVRDRDLNTWIGTADALVRLTANGRYWSDQGVRSAERKVTALFEDREGNLWVGSPSGLERFRDPLFGTYGPSGQNSIHGPIYMDDKDRLWFAPASGGLCWQRQEQQGCIKSADLGNEVVYSISGGKDEIWVGRRRGGLTCLRSVNGAWKSTTYTRSKGLAQDSIYSVLRDPTGTVWAGSLTGGVTKITSDELVTYTTRDGLASNMVTAIARTRDGTVWFAGPCGLSSLANGRWRNYTADDGLPPDGVNYLFEDSQGTLWIGTDRGLAYIRTGHIGFAGTHEPALQDRIFGINEDGAGWLWVTSATHVLRVDRTKLLNDLLTKQSLRQYETSDGLPSTSGIRRSQSVALDSRGRVWLSLEGGLAVVDPLRLNQVPIPALAQIRSIVADGSSLPLRGSVDIPPLCRRVLLNFTGPNLSAPQRVLFKYRLDGFDRSWSEAVTSREAAYTNLGPGTYKFRVTASNPDGFWSEQEASLQLHVEPAFWDTWWFRTTGFFALALAIGVVYRFRMNQITSQLQVRFEERLSERNRIAQELHDTLLQAFLSASMQVHVAYGRLGSESPAKAPLERAIDLIGRASREGRTVLRGLRSQAIDSLSFEQAFSRLAQELAAPEEMTYTVTVEGRPKILRQALRDEVYRIGRESVLNAFRHSGGAKIEVEIEYALTQLRLLIRDDGCGIDTQVLRTGRDGHWGLTGIRERAEHIGARLTILSSPQAGTEVVLLVPGHIAYLNRPEHSWRHDFGAALILQPLTKLRRKK